MTENRENKRNAGSLKGWRTRRALFTLFLSIVLILSDIPVSLLVSIFGNDNSIVKEIDGLREVKAAELTKLVVYGQDVNLHPFQNKEQLIKIDVGGVETEVARYKSGVLVLLRSVSRSVDDSDGINASIYALGDLTIKLNNRITIENTKETADELYGIYVSGQLTLANASEFTTRLIVKCSGTATKKSAGIYAGSLSMRTGRLGAAEKVAVSANGATVDSGGSIEIKPLSAGIYTSGDMDIAAGTVAGVGGNINGYDGLSAGIYADKLTVSSPAKLAAYGGTADSNVSQAKVDGVRSAGIFCSSTFTATGGAQVTAVGGSSILYSFGTYAADMTVVSENTALSTFGGNVSETAKSDGVPFSIGLCAVNSYTQEDGTVTTKGGKGETKSSYSLGASSAGLCTKTLSQSGGELYATGGAVTNKTSVSSVYTYGIYLGNISKDAGGYMCVTGGTMEAVGGDLIEAGTDKGGSYGISQYETGVGDCIIENCRVTVKSGSFIGDGGASYAEAYGFSGRLTVKGGAELTAESGVIDEEKGNSYFKESIAISGRLTIEGGIINAKAHGGVITEGICSSGFIVKSGSNAVINVHAEKSPVEAGISQTYAINSRGDFIMEEGCNAVLTAIVDGLGIDSNCYNYGLYLYPAAGAECSLAGGVIDVVMNCGGSTGGDTYGIMCGRDAEICGSEINVQMNGRDQRMTGIGSETPAGSVSMTSGAINVSCDTQGKTHPREGDNKGFCYALSLSTTVAGGELTLTSNETDNPTIIASGATLDGGIISTSTEGDGSGSGYTDDSVINGGISGSIQYVRAVSGTKAAPPVADIHIVQKYHTDSITASFANVMPADAGEVRYVAGTATVVNSADDPSVNTTVSNFTIGSKNGIVSAEVEAIVASAGDVITLPVSIRSEGYRPVSANVIVQITDKDLAEVDISGDSEKQYGDGEYTLTAQADPAGEHPVISWSSSNTAVADIDADGKVTVKAVGTTMIHADYSSDTSMGTASMTLTVSPRKVRFGDVGVADRVYDGTTDAEINIPITLYGVLEEDASKLSLTGFPYFEDKNAGTDKNVYFDDYKLGAGPGGDARANYVLEQPAAVKASITPKAVTVTVTAVNREYEKDKLTVVLTAGTVSGVIAGDIVSVDVSGAVGTMADDAAGEDKAVTVSGVKLAGADAGNYTLTSQPTGVTVTISEAHTLPDPVDEEPEHKHTMVHHAAVAATEEADGNIEYWECSECKKLYKDAEGKTEITLADTVIPKLPDPTTVTREMVTEAVSETVNGMPVSISLNIVYPEAVSWTGAKITKAQLEALSGEGGIVKVNFKGLEEALKGKMKEGTDVSKLVTVSYTPSKDKNAGTKGYFTLKAKLNSKAVKKAKIKGADKKALNTLVKKLNEQQKTVKYEYEIVPVKLADAESITIKAKLKKGALQLDEQGKLKGFKSVRIKVQIKGLKKAKTFTYNAKKAKDLFMINITDAAAKTAELSALPGTSFKGSRSGITIGK